MQLECTKKKKRNTISNTISYKISLSLVAINSANHFLALSLPCTTLFYIPQASEDSIIFQENKTLGNTYSCVYRQYFCDRFPWKRGVNIFFKNRDEWSLTSRETSEPNNFAGYFSDSTVFYKNIYIWIFGTGVTREHLCRIDPRELEDEYKYWYTKVIRQVNQRLKIEWYKAFNQR